MTEKIIPGSYCLVCGKPAVSRLGIRARNKETNAYWAPELGVFLCLAHTHSGAEIEIRYQESASGRVRARVFHDGRTVSLIDHPIRATSPESEKEPALF